MKTKNILIVLTLFLYTNLTLGQYIEDALRYARPQLTGTARFVALGGAFNALGGDMSAISENPAAAAVFLHSELGVSLNYTKNQIDAGYFNNFRNINSGATNIDQFGIVFVMTNGSSDFSKLSFAYNFKGDQRFDTKFNAYGVNPSKGIDDYFLSFAQGVPFVNIDLAVGEGVSNVYQYLGDNIGFGAQQAFLGYQSYIINPSLAVSNNTDYISASNPQKNSLNHNFFVTETGANKKHSFTVSTQYRDNLYLGMNINSYNSEFKRTDYLRENNYGDGSDFIETEFENELSTLADGFSIQLGAIYKPSPNIRLGLSYQSPTWYRIQEELVQYVATYREDSSDEVDPQIINLYEYNVKTPSKLSTGLAYIFGSKGLISFEYNLVNFQNIEFDTQQGNDDSINLNKEIKSTLKKAATYRIGGEYRIEELSLRGGYFSHQNLNKTTPDFSKGYSLGIGYDFGGSNLSATFLKQKSERTELIYQQGLKDPIDLNKEQVQIVVTYSLKL